MGENRRDRRATARMPGQNESAHAEAAPELLAEPSQCIIDELLQCAGADQSGNVIARAARAAEIIATRQPRERRTVAPGRAGTCRVGEVEAAARFLVTVDAHGLLAAGVAVEMDDDVDLAGAVDPVPLEDQIGRRAAVA